MWKKPPVGGFVTSDGFTAACVPSITIAHASAQAQPQAWMGRHGWGGAGARTGVLHSNWTARGLLQQKLTGVKNLRLLFPFVIGIFRLGMAGLNGWNRLPRTGS